MGISAVQASQYANETPSIIHNRQNQPGTLITPPAPQYDDSVEISQDARDLARQLSATKSDAPAETGPASPEGALPLEAYSLPQWYVDLSSDLLQVDTELGVSYSESRMARYDALSGQEKDDLAEYQDILHSYFQEELANIGVESSLDYYTRIVQDPQQSEEVHQAVRQKLLANQRALQLMDYFGISTGA